MKYQNLTWSRTFLQGRHLIRILALFGQKFGTFYICVFWQSLQKIIMAAESEFADYLTMESFFTAESAMASQQNGFSATPNQQSQQHQQHQQAADYLIPMDQQQYASYDQQATAMAVDPLHINQTTPEKFEFHNNNNNHNNNNSVQYFYESNNSVQQQILQQPQHQIHQTSEFYVSHKIIILVVNYSRNQDLRSCFYNWRCFFQDLQQHSVMRDLW